MLDKKEDIFIKLNPDDLLDNQMKMKRKDNNIMKLALQNIYYESNLFELYNVDVNEFFKNFDYYDVSKEFVDEVINTEIMDTVVEYSENVKEIYFKLGIDITLSLLGKDPIFYNLDEVKDPKFEGENNE